MEQDSSKAPAGGGQSANPLLLLVTLLAGALLVRQLPLIDSRPSTPEPKVYSYIAANKVDARLWQDPIGAVARWKKEEQPKGATRADDKGAPPAKPRLNELQVQLRENPAQRPIVLGVMVPGGPYSGYAEWRRKARYAVISGLAAMGYTPEDPEHLEYFKLDNYFRATIDRKHGGDALPAADFIAYEWFEVALESAAPSGNPAPARRAKVESPGGRRVVVLWLDQELFWDTPMRRIDGLFAELFGVPPGAASKATNASAAKDKGAKETAAQDRASKPHVDILGPGDSTLLKHMVQEVAADEAYGVDFRFYDYAATASDDVLLGAAKSVPEEVNRLDQYFDAHDLKVFRTIGNDRQLACALRDELALRGIGSPKEAVPPRPSGSPPITFTAPEVVLISEWDSDYGRSLSDIAQRAFSDPKVCPVPKWENPTPRRLRAADLVASHWLHTYTYLRGLDGRVPERVSQGSSSGSAGGSANGDDKPQAVGGTGDAKAIERAQGEGQLDYLRRLALRLQAMDASARRDGEKGVRAIGILGSDVYDKLVVLQAFRPAFPNTLFFTTDLDARMVHPQELDWTRNLLVASSFDLELAPDLQSGILPFRDGYQTSLFLATLIALNNEDCKAKVATAHGTKRPSCLVDQAQIALWRTQPRLFEIGRRGPYDISEAGDGKDDGGCAVATLGNCISVHPNVRAVKPVSGRVWGLAYATFALGMIALALVKGAGPRVRAWATDREAEHHRRWRRRVRKHWLMMGIIALSLLIGLGVALPYIADWLAALLAQGGRGVPMSLLDGVSIWPTEIIRVIALITALIFIWRGWRDLDSNSNHTSREMRWEKERKELEKELKEEYKDWKWWQWLLHVFSFRLDARQPTVRRHDEGNPDAPAAQGPIDPKTGLLPEAEAFWRSYMYQGRFWARVCRIVVAIAIYFVFAFAVASMFPVAELAIRGELARKIDVYLVLAAAVTMLFLIFFVVDATLLCRQFVTAISRRKMPEKGVPPEDFDTVGGETRWPEGTLWHFSRKLKLDVKYVDQWVTIHVIGLRTKAISRLIYYPYIIISLMIIARSSIFDNWAMPVALIIILGTSVLVVTVSAVMLRMAAEYARHKTIWRLTNEMVRLNNGGPAQQATAKQLDILIGQIHRYETGSFASYRDQPLLRAVLLPLGSAGGVGVLQYLAIWNF